MLNDFREFINRGNVLDLTIGIVLGAAFAKIVDSFVKDILMPPVGLLTGGVDFASLYINLSGKTYRSLAEANAAGAPTINYGLFLNSIIVFLIVAFAIFMVVKAYNRVRRPAEAPAAPSERDCPFCATKIPSAAKRCPHCTSEIGEMR